MKLMAVQGKGINEWTESPEVLDSNTKKTYWLLEIEQKKKYNSWGNSMTFSLSWTSMAIVTET